MIQFQNVSFSYGKKKVLENISFSLGEGEILAVMGESGCGKSTLLHLAAGLLKPTEGAVVSDFSRISYAFQEPRLFPWLTVEQNIAAVLPSPEQERTRIQKALDTVELSTSGNLYPRQLSGGMKSRASLARALAYGGDLFLLDEPFAALNEDLRALLIQRLREELRANRAAAILVTHQRADAEALADRVLEL
ncbi:MAG: ATP-binding cassette domain-containing protein [Clostridia bacterium]|nr:ATP-binding cassette domain-containing protein [Clostridia bacterium]